MHRRYSSLAVALLFLWTPSVTHADPGGSSQVLAELAQAKAGKERRRGKAKGKRGKSGRRGDGPTRPERPERTKDAPAPSNRFGLGAGASFISLTPVESGSEIKFTGYSGLATATYEIPVNQFKLPLFTGLSYFLISAENEFISIKASGSSLHLGGSLLYPVTPKVAVGPLALYSILLSGSIDTTFENPFSGGSESSSEKLATFSALQFGARAEYILNQSLNLYLELYMNKADVGPDGDTSGMDGFGVAGGFTHWL